MSQVITFTATPNQTLYAHDGTHTGIRCSGGANGFYTVTLEPGYYVVLATATIQTDYSVNIITELNVQQDVDVDALAQAVSAAIGSDRMVYLVSQYDPLRKRLTLVQGDDYNTTLGTQIDIPVILPSGIVVGDTLTVALAATNEQDSSKRIDVTGLSLVYVAGKPNIRLVAPASVTEDAPAGMYSMQIFITKNSTQYTPIDGRLELLKSQQAS